jgi:hypothetical protein
MLGIDMLELPWRDRIHSGQSFGTSLLRPGIVGAGLCK